MLFTTVVPAGRSKGCRTLGVSMGIGDSGTAQCHLLLRSNMWSLDSHSSNTPGEKLRGSKPCPRLSCLSLHIFSL